MTARSFGNLWVSSFAMTQTRRWIAIGYSNHWVKLHFLLRCLTSFLTLIILWRSARGVSFHSLWTNLIPHPGQYSLVEFALWSLPSLMKTYLTQEWMAWYQQRCLHYNWSGRAAFSAVDILKFYTLRRETPVTITLTHLALGKMAAFSQTIYSDALSWMKSFFILVNVSLKFVPKDPIDNNLALVQIMPWRRRGDKPLSEPVLTWFSDANMRH